MGKQIGKYTVTDNELRRVTKVLDFGGCEFETILTKEAFVECYRRWILEEGEGEHLARLGSLGPGEAFELGGFQWVVLDDEYPTLDGVETGVFCLAKDILFDRAFDEGRRNNWKESSLRDYLNGTFKAELVGKIGADPFKPFDRDLTSDDGMTDYGSCTDCISLLSNDEYRKYRSYIDFKEDSWLTLTPYSCREEYSERVRFVSYDGACDVCGTYGLFGAVPAFLLDAGTKVGVAGGESKEA